MYFENIHNIDQEQHLYICTQFRPKLRKNQKFLIKLKIKHKNIFERYFRTSERFLKKYTTNFTFHMLKLLINVDSFRWIFDRNWVVFIIFFINQVDEDILKLRCSSQFKLLPLLINKLFGLIHNNESRYSQFILSFALFLLWIKLLFKQYSLHYYSFNLYIQLWEINWKNIRCCI